MTGPEHYREAERLARAANKADTAPAIQSLALLAQVHATLAQVAVTATGHGPDWAGAFLGNSDEMEV